MSLATSAEFFPSLVENLARALNVRYAVVSEFLPGEDQLRSIALWNSDHIAENLEKPIQGSPCGRIRLSGREYVQTSGAAACFANDPFLQALRIEGYFGVPLLDANSTPIGSLCVFDAKPLVDIGRIRQFVNLLVPRASAELQILLAQEAAHRREQFLGTVTELLPALLFAVDKTGRFSYCNQRLVQYTGVDVRLWGEAAWTHLIHPADLPALLHLLGSGFANEQPFEFRARLWHHSGLYRWHFLRAVPLPQHSPLPVSFLVSCTDIEQQVESQMSLVALHKQLEERVEIRTAELTQTVEKLQLSEETTRALLESAAQTILGVDPKGTIRLANASTERMFGYAREELIGQPLDILIPVAAGLRHRQHMARFMTNPHPRPIGLLGHTLRGRRKDGTEFPVEVALSQFRNPQGLLSVAFVSDISERQRAEDTLRASEERFRTIANAAPILVWMTGQDRLRYWFNQPWLAFTGRTIEEEMGWGWLEAVHPHDRDDIHQVRGKAFLERLPFRQEFRLQRHDGEFRWLLDHGVPHFSRSGEFLGYVGSCVDITDHRTSEAQLRESLQEKTVLLKEIHHRVKNNLMVVSSLLSMQASTVSDPETVRMLEHSQSRVQSMALVHEYLYGSDRLDRINFAEYAERLAAELHSTCTPDISCVTLRIEAEPVNLSVHRAVPCGLILNELLTNAFKYAFPGDLKGQVTVRFRQSPADLLHLTVEDNGVGVPAGLDWRHANSLGLQIVQLLVRQIDGSIELTRGAGTRFDVIFPCPRTYAER